jgi:methionyl-tRNA formyltransferase
MNWQLDAQSICRRVRAFNPFPGASAVLNGETIKVWKASPGRQQGAEPAGTVLAVGPEGITVSARDSTVMLQELQRPGGKRLAVGDFLRGFAVQPGLRFERPDQSAGVPPV